MSHAFCETWGFPCSAINTEEPHNTLLGCPPSLNLPPIRLRRVPLAVSPLGPRSVDLTSHRKRTRRLLCSSERATESEVETHTVLAQNDGGGATVKPPNGIGPGVLFELQSSWSVSADETLPCTTIERFSIVLPLRRLPLAENFEDQSEELH